MSERELLDRIEETERIICENNTEMESLRNRLCELRYGSNDRYKDYVGKCFRIDMFGSDTRYIKIDDVTIHNDLCEAMCYIEIKGHGIIIDKLSELREVEISDDIGMMFRPAVYDYENRRLVYDIDERMEAIGEDEYDSLMNGYFEKILNV